ncbi:hypothetical protein NDU88_000864 [Pleurodeles waltl]|uniref:Uncharacterized protein n=1 Tax=Pleurodeles waltl TaxID=8319 RepID=A0AAV7PAX1_PLEWA|nr:hypothetical protein NDU88_000864 [Pleurodeles waltl]
MPPQSLPWPHGVFRWVVLSLLMEPNMVADGILQTGEISSLIYHKYPDNMRRNQTWHLHVARGYRIRLRFTHFDVARDGDNCQDYVKVSDGQKPTLTICGHRDHPTERSPQVPMVLFSTSNRMTVKFYSTGSKREHLGSFSARYVAVDIDECAFRNGQCEQLCYNFPGSFSCDCNLGFTLRPDNRTCEAPDCGRLEKPLVTYARIFGGSSAGVENFPWHAQIKVIGNPYVGKGAGALIASHWVLTSVSDLVGVPATTIQVELDLEKKALIRRHRVENIFIHPSYATTRAPGQNIALLKLVKPVQFTKRVMPICLPSKGGDLYSPGRMGYVSGYGETELAKISLRMKYTVLPILDDITCQAGQREAGLDGSQILFCAGYLEGEMASGPCQGDVGSPFVVYEYERKVWVLAGLTAWVRGCRNSGKYSFYTHISQHLPWITSVVSSQ